MLCIWLVNNYGIGIGLFRVGGIVYLIVSNVTNYLNDKYNEIIKMEKLKLLHLYLIYYCSTLVQLYLPK